MAEEEDKAQKTEEPTRKKLDDAFKKGQVAFSREVMHFFMLIALSVILLLIGPSMMVNTTNIIDDFIEHPHNLVLDINLINHLLLDVGIAVSLAMTVAIIAAFAGALIQKKPGISIEPIKPKLEKISVIKGIKRLFSMRSIAEFIKGIIKLTIVGVACVLVVWSELDRLDMLHQYDIDELMIYLGTLTGYIMITVCIIMFLVAIVDYSYQQHEFIKNMRMTKQEVKDEYKQQEGDPIVKQKLKSIRLERAQRRMMESVPDASVIITNPTHYSIALKYTSGEMNAPIVLAKGEDKVALRIREVAEKHDVPIVENKPLARSLYPLIEIGEEIPISFYQAVAEVISYIYKKEGRVLDMS